VTDQSAKRQLKCRDRSETQYLKDHLWRLRLSWQAAKFDAKLVTSIQSLARISRAEGEGWEYVTFEQPLAARLHGIQHHRRKRRFRTLGKFIARLLCKTAGIAQTYD
jgi:hypothetical protein